MNLNLLKQAKMPLDFEPFLLLRTPSREHIIKSRRGYKMSNSSIRYDDEFKFYAVKMVVEQKRAISAVASGLSVSQPIIRSGSN